MAKFLKCSNICQRFKNILTPLTAIKNVHASTTEFETSVLPTQGDRRGGGGGQEDTAVPKNSEVR